MTATVRLAADGLTEQELAEATEMLDELVAAEAALGWVDPPGLEEVRRVLAGPWGEDGALAVATIDGHLAGLGYWKRYDRPTHRPNADVEKVAVAPRAQGHGVGRALMTALIAAAVDARIEVLTLDLRADNQRAAALYESLGFLQYGRLPGFVALDIRRWDKLFYYLDLRGPAISHRDERG